MGSHLNQPPQPFTQHNGNLIPAPKGWSYTGETRTGWAPTGGNKYTWPSQELNHDSPPIQLVISHYTDRENDWSSNLKEMSDEQLV